MSDLETLRVRMNTAHKNWHDTIRFPGDLGSADALGAYAKARRDYEDAKTSPAPPATKYLSASKLAAHLQRYDLGDDAPAPVSPRIRVEEL